MPLTGMLVDVDTRQADGIRLTAVALIGRHEPDAAVVMLIVVPTHECRHPEAGFVLAAEWPPRVVWLVLDRSEQRF
jgi:hypothetical protein